jgi:hypothetical protein
MALIWATMQPIRPSRWGGEGQPWWIACLCIHGGLRVRQSVRLRMSSWIGEGRPPGRERGQSRRSGGVRDPHDAKKKLCAMDLRRVKRCKEGFPWSAPIWENGKWIMMAKPTTNRPSSRKHKQPRQETDLHEVSSFYYVLRVRPFLSCLDRSKFRNGWDIFCRMENWRVYEMWNRCSVKLFIFWTGVPLFFSKRFVPFIIKFLAGDGFP